MILLRGPRLLLGRSYYEPLLWFMIPRDIKFTQSRCIAKPGEAMGLKVTNISPEVSEHTLHCQHKHNQQVSEVPLQKKAPCTIHLVSANTSHTQASEMPQSMANPTVLGMPIIHLSCQLKDPPWIQLTLRGISPMAESIAQSNQTRSNCSRRTGKC